MRYVSTLILMFMTLVMIIPLAEAVGLRAVNLKPMVDFEPGLERSFEYTIITNADKEQDYKVTIKGDSLSKYITVEPEVQKIPAGGSATFIVRMKLPNEASKIGPGMHSVEVRVDETQTRGGGSIGVKTAAAANILLRVHYPEKHLKASMSVPNGEVGGEIPITLVAENWGATAFKKVGAIIAIKNADGKTVKTLNSYTAEIPPRDKVSIVTLLDAIGFEKGEYTADVIVTADEQKQELSQNFYIGSKTLQLQKIKTVLQANTLNSIPITVKSDWNSPMSAFAVLEIGNEKIRTVKESLAPRQEQSLTAYWDTTGVSLGKHIAKLTIIYDGGKLERDVAFTIQEGEGPTTMATRGLSPLVTTIIVVGVVILLINILVVIFLIKKRR